MKNLVYLIISGCLIFFLITGCELDKEEKKDVVDAAVGDVTVDVVKGVTLKEACEKYREALCERHVACGNKNVETMEKCLKWFNTKYGACENIPADKKLTPEAEGYLNECIKGLETADCKKLYDDGAEATVPSCAKF